MIINPNKSRHPTVNETGIYGFFDEFRWLSNFHPCKIEFEGLIYPSTEHAYQAAKTFDQPTRIALTTCTTGQAKKIGDEILIERDNWEFSRVMVMTVLLMKKFSIPELQQKLLLTDGYYLEETNNWNDKFWGVVNGDGKNMLGCSLMLVRNHYKSLSN